VITLIVGSGLIVSGFNSFYNDFYNKPHIGIQINPPTQNSDQSVVIINEGRVPATTFLLTLQTPHNLDDLPRIVIFSTLNETKFTLRNSSLLQVGAPIFPHGDGSIVRINLRYNVSESSTVYPQYIAYITYDQGSSKIFIGKPWTLIDVVSNFLTTYWIQIASIAVGIYILLVISFLLKLGRSGRQVVIGLGGRIYIFFLPLIPGIYFYLLGRHGYRRAEQIYDSIIRVRQEITSLDPKMDYSETWLETEEETRRQILGYDRKAYDLIESLFSMLHERHLLTVPSFVDVNDPKVKGELDVFDSKIKEKCDEAVNNINWKGIISPKQ
jgi:hypothetical protein